MGGLGKGRKGEGENPQSTLSFGFRSASENGRSWPFTSKVHDSEETRDDIAMQSYTTLLSSLFNATRGAQATEKATRRKHEHRSSNTENRQPETWNPFG